MRELLKKLNQLAEQDDDIKNFLTLVSTKDDLKIIEQCLKNIEQKTSSFG